MRYFELVFPDADALVLAFMKTGFVNAKLDFNGRKTYMDQTIMVALIGLLQILFKEK